MGQPDANWCAKTNAKTNAIHAKSISWIPKVEKPMATNKKHKMTIQKHKQQLQQTIPARTMHKTQGHAHQKLQPDQKHTPLDHWMHKNATSTTQVPEKATPHIFSMQKQHPQCTGHNTEHITGHNPMHSQGPSPMHSQWHNPGHSPGHSTGHSPIPSPGHNTRHNPGHTTRHNTGPKPRAQHSPMHSPGHSPGHNRMHNSIHSTWQKQTTSINPTLQYTISIGFCIEIFAKTQIIENTGPFVTRASLYGTFWGPIKGLPFKKDVLGECCFPD